jgi:hypothetical protein
LASAAGPSAFISAAIDMAAIAIFRSRASKACTPFIIIASVFAACA